MWKAIRKGCDFLVSWVAFKVGGGMRVKFWKDRWYREEPLVESFSSLFKCPKTLGWRMCGMQQ